MTEEEFKEAQSVIHDGPLFEVVDHKKGHTYRIYASGKIEGFPDEVFIFNHAVYKFDHLLSLLRREIDND